MLVSFHIEKIEPLADGAPFGDVGAYERVVAKAKGEVDPRHPGNAGIALIDKAPPRRIWISIEHQAEHLDLLLRDNGPGFSAESLARAREPFFTTKTSAQGLGLGLAICDSLVRALDGELLLANHPAGGALITLRLRLAEPGTNPYPPEDLSA